MLSDKLCILGEREHSPHPPEGLSGLTHLIRSITTYRRPAPDRIRLVTASLPSDARQCIAASVGASSQEYETGTSATVTSRPLP